MCHRVDAFPSLLGVITAAKLIGEIAGVDRFDNDAQLARLAGCAPVPVSSGRTDRYRLDRGGNRLRESPTGRSASSGRA
jgi:transposase